MESVAQQYFASSSKKIKLNANWRGNTANIECGRVHGVLVLGGSYAFQIIRQSAPLVRFLIVFKLYNY